MISRKRWWFWTAAGVLVAGAYSLAHRRVISID